MPYRGSKISKSSNPQRGSFSRQNWVLYIMNGRHILLSARTGQEKQALCFWVSVNNLSFPSGIPISHRATYSVLGREVQLLQAFLTGYSYLALRVYPVPPLGSVDWLSLSGIGGCRSVVKGRLRGGA